MNETNERKKKMKYINIKLSAFVACTTLAFGLGGCTDEQKKKMIVLAFAGHRVTMLICIAM